MVAAATYTSDEVDRIQRFADTYAELRVELGKRIVGMDHVIEDLLISFFAGGHALLIGVPGLAKTLLISSLADCLQLSFRRIQFTPDLMPSDIVGAEMLVHDPETQKRHFRFLKGPVFANVVLADEINRTPPKTQAALMEAMEEGQITSVGEHYAIEKPFFVLATQNPIEQEGTYPLPAAQLDRFLFSIHVDYPAMEEERAIVRLTTSRKPKPLRTFLGQDAILDLQRLVRRQDSPPEILRYVLALVRSSRKGRPEAAPFVDEWLAWGAGPRAAQALILGGKARALLHGRTAVSAADIRALASPVLRHRLIPSFQAEADGVGADEVIARLVAETPAPDRTA
jgi:MoxR-like ATPase